MHICVCINFYVMCVCVVRVTVPRQFLNIAKERYNIVYRKTRYIHLSFDSKRGYIRRRKSRRSIKSNSLSTCENFFFFLSFFFFFLQKYHAPFISAPFQRVLSRTKYFLEIFNTPDVADYVSSVWKKI